MLNSKAQCFKRRQERRLRSRRPPIQPSHRRYSRGPHRCPHADHRPRQASNDDLLAEPGRGRRPSTHQNRRAVSMWALESGRRGVSHAVPGSRLRLSRKTPPKPVAGYGVVGLLGVIAFHMTGLRLSTAFLVTTVNGIDQRSLDSILPITIPCCSSHQQQNFIESETNARSQ